MGECMAVQVVLQLADDSLSKGAPTITQLETWVNAAMQAPFCTQNGNSRNTDWIVGIRLVGAEEIQRLNRDFRGKDSTTNILSFPTDDDYWEPNSDTKELGDLVICTEVVLEEARCLMILPEDHWAHMVVHGCLHLLGYDHECLEDAQVMERLETELLAKMHIADPYAESVEL